MYNLYNEPYKERQCCLLLCQQGPVQIDRVVYLNYQL